MRCPLLKGLRTNPNHLILAVHKLFQCKMYSSLKCLTQLLSKDSIESLKALYKLSHSSRHNSLYLYHQHNKNLDRSSLNSKMMATVMNMIKMKMRLQQPSLSPWLKPRQHK